MRRRKGRGRKIQLQTICTPWVSYVSPLFYRESVDDIVLVLTIQIKATEQYYYVVLHAYLAVQGAANFQVCGWNANKVWPFKILLPGKWKASPAERTEFLPVSILAALVRLA